MSRSHEVVSLFSGAGGMDIGFEQAGFRTVWANDSDANACRTHQLWSDAEVIHGDISKVGVDTIPNCDVVLGGFPCQGFSLAGPRRIDDHRNALYRYFVNVVETLQPRAFVAENVKGILTLGAGSIIDAIIADFETKGYEVTHQLVNAADFGVPQDRHRVILVGVHHDLGKRFHFPEPDKRRVSIREALSGLSEPAEEDVCMAHFSSRYMSRNRRRDWSDVSYTIPAMAKQCPLHPSSPAMNHVGVDQWEFGAGTTRRFSWQEAAAIQSFPPGMEFVGDLTSKYRQIGNAVPVELARRVGLGLLSTIGQA